MLLLFVLCYAFESWSMKSMRRKSRIEGQGGKREEGGGKRERKVLKSSWGVSVRCQRGSWRLLEGSWRGLGRVLEGSWGDLGMS